MSVFSCLAAVGGKSLRNNLQPSRFHSSIATENEDLVAFSAIDEKRQVFAKRDSNTMAVENKGLSRIEGRQKARTRTIKSDSNSMLRMKSPKFNEKIESQVRLIYGEVRCSRDNPALALLRSSIWNLS
jgi:hypothetical protein